MIELLLVKVGKTERLDCRLHVVAERGKRRRGEEQRRGEEKRENKVARSAVRFVSFACGEDEGCGRIPSPHPLTFVNRTIGRTRQLLNETWYQSAGDRGQGTE